jgi:carboxyl-terminal processing protease
LNDVFQCIMAPRVHLACIMRGFSIFFLALLGCTVAMAQVKAPGTKPATPAAPTKPKADPPAPPSKAPAPAAPTPSPDPAPKPKEDSDDPYVQFQTLSKAMDMIREHYVDEKKVTYKELIQGALEGMLSRLDPHCEYMGRQLFEDMQREQADTSEGVGITIALRDAGLTIVTVRDDGPASKAGVLPGDLLVRIGEVLTDSVGVAEALRLLKGKAGQPVRLTINRPGTRQFLEFTIVRELLQESSIFDPMLVHDKIASPWKIGYVRISEFTQSTAKDLARALDKMEAEGMEALVLDLRNNPGGLLDSAIAVCGEFLPENTVVVTTEGRSAVENAPPYRTPKREGQPHRTYPLAVLCNHSSASAAEITAGVMQDLRRAIIVGTTTFGKGSVQTILPMDDGTALRVTTAKYYTPSHRTIHEHGVTPNIISTLTTEEELRVSKFRGAHRTGEAASLDLANLGDRQFERAVDALKGVLIYREFTKAPATPTAPAAVAKRPETPPTKFDALLAPADVKGEPVAPKKK